MRPSERHARLNRLNLAIQAALADQGLTDRIEQAIGGFGSTELGRLTSRSLASPVEAALGLPSDNRDDEDEKRKFTLNTDPARDDLDRYDQLVKTLSIMGDELDEIRRRYPPARRISTNLAGKSSSDSCEVCWTAGRWSAPREGPDTNIDGALPRTYRLCTVCVKLCANLGRLPKPFEHAEAHTKGFVKMRAAK